MKRSTLIDTAGECLQPVELGRRRAYYAEETSEWYWVSQREMTELGRLLRDGVPDAYSHWCASVATRPVSGAALRRLRMAYR